MGLPQGELSGVAIAETITADLTERVGRLQAEGTVVGLALLNANPEHKPSEKYVNLKRQKAHQIGVVCHPVQETSASGLDDFISIYNSSTNVQGIMVQLPLQPHELGLTDRILNSVAAVKDVDGLRTDGNSPFTPATPNAILNLLEGHGVDLAHESVTILGSGRLVGAPLFAALKSSGALQVQIVDEHDTELDRIAAIDEASVVVSAMGMPGMLDTTLFSDLSRRRVLVDAGSAEQAGRVSGDVSPELRSVALQNQWGITPVKGGVGVLTVASLLQNTVMAAERQVTAVA